MPRFLFILSGLLLWMQNIYAAEAVVKLGAGVGPAGSKNNIISISIANDEPIRAAQFQIADIPDFLKPDSVWLTFRCNGFSVSTYDTSGVLGIVLMFSNADAVILPDTGAVLNISYTVMQQNPAISALDLVFFSQPKLMGKNYATLPVQSVNSKFIIGTSSAVQEKPPSVESYQLQQNYPNPFNPSTIIAFSIPRPGQVQLEILNILGQEVRSLTDRHYTSGMHQVIWDGFDDAGQQAPAGVYFYRLRADGYATARQLVLMR